MALSRAMKMAIAIAVVLVLVLATATWWLVNQLTTTTITAYFDRAVGIYTGSDVRILGVAVGEVDSVEPVGDQVRIIMSVDRSFDVPADARAVQISPSVVSDRYIQLTPVYRGGPKMERTVTIERERTATPVEVDQLYRSITELSEALGPEGANADGAVNDLVRTTSANLSDNGRALADSIGSLSAAARTLSDTRGDIFTTVEHLQKFVTMLARNDQQVRQFNTQLADLSEFLAGERHNLGEALELLSLALGDVARFVNDNRDLVAGNAERLTTLTQTLADQRDDLAEALPKVPVALSNLINIHNAESGTLDMRANFPDLQDPAGALCSLIDMGKLKPGDPEFEALGKQARPLLESCEHITDQVTAAVQSPDLVLPFGILSAENQQRYPVPGTVPGTPSHRLPPSQGGP